VPGNLIFGPWEGLAGAVAHPEIKKRKTKGSQEEATRGSESARIEIIKVLTGKETLEKM